MNNLPQDKNTTFVNGDAIPVIYRVKDTDDIINVDTTLGAVTIILINIMVNNLPFYSKPITINDISGTSGTNKITIQATNNLINGHNEIYLDAPYASVLLNLANDNSWIASFGVVQSQSDTYKVKVSATDLQADYLQNKLVQGAGITFTILDILGVKALQISSSASALLIANTIFVSENGNDATGQINNWGLPFRTIAAANSAATGPTVIYVMPGSYTETTIWCKSNNVYYLEPNSIVTSNTSIIDDLNIPSNFTILGFGQLISTNNGVISAQNKESVIKINAKSISATTTSTFLFDLNCSIDICVDDIVYSNPSPPTTVAAIRFGVVSKGQIISINVSVANKSLFGISTANKIIFEATTILNNNFGQQMLSNGTGQFVLVASKATFSSVFAIDAAIFALSNIGSFQFLGQMIAQNSVFSVQGGQLEILNSNIRSAVGKCIIASGASASNIFVQNSWLVSLNAANIEMSGSGPVVNVFNSYLKVNSGIANPNISLLDRFPLLKVSSTILDTSGVNSINAAFNPTSIRVLLNCIANKIPSASTVNAITGTSIVVDALAVVTPPNII